MKNLRSLFIRIVTEIVDELNISMEIMSQGWILYIHNQHQKIFINGYQFGLNSDSGSKICWDKAATSELLLLHGLPCVEHFFFHSYSEYYPSGGNWIRLTQLLNTYKKLVIKPNEGTMGNNIYQIETITELELYYHQLIAKGTVAISPYEDIVCEYRVVVLDDEAQLVFSKAPQQVIGDGIQTLGQLIIELNTPYGASYLQNFDDDMLGQIISENKCVQIGWQHNLGKGATAIILDNTHHLYDDLCQLAIKATQLLQLRFCSVDIIINTDNILKIIEINAGVSMVHIAQLSNENYDLVKNIYKKALCLGLE